MRNHYSSLSAAGDINVETAVFENKGAGGGEQRNLTATLYTRDRGQYNAFIRTKNQFNSDPESVSLDQVLATSSGIHNVIDRRTPIAGAVVAPAVVQSAGAVTINATQRIDNSVVRANHAGAGALSGRSDASADPRQAQTQVRALNPQLPPDLAQRQVNPVTLPSFSLPQGNNGLFRISSQAGQVATSGSALTGPGDLTQAGSGVFIAPLATTTATDISTAQALAATSSAGAQGAGTTGMALDGLAAGVTLVQGVPERSAPSVSHKYLVETNPVLTDLKQFLSSDYLLGQLNVKPDQAIKRLGDGLYEQRLIREAVVARTGQRYIDGETRDETLFRYLMDNAIASKEQLSLSVGVSLSAEQVAALTHDIVWMENVEVDGETVLAPVLYLAHANGRLAPNGALIQGRDVKLISGGELANVGTLRASNNLSVSAANIDNTGLMEAGGRLDMLATESIRNAQGGIIAGRDVSLIALTGNVINERSVTRLEGRAGGEHVTKDLVDTAARIEAANDLTITAGQDIGIVGGSLQAGRDINLDAGHDLIIASQEGVDSHEYQRRRVSGYDTSITQYGSEIKAGGNLTATAGQDLTVIASEIEARRDLALQAGNDVTLAAAADEEHSYAKGRKGRTKYTQQEDDTRQQSSVVTAGGNLAIDAGRDLRMVASKASAGDEAYLVAGDKLELLAANDSQYSLYDMSKKGGWGSKKTQRDEVTDVKAVGSEVTSGGDLTLASGGDQLYQGAKVVSGADLTIDSGGAITFEAVKDLHQESHEKSKGDLAWNSMKGKGNTDETLRQTQMQAAGEITIKAVEGLTVDIKHIDHASVSQSIDAMVAADPQLAWLKEAEQRGGVDWRKVKEVHDSFKYSHSGLGAGAQMVIAILIAYFTAGAASGLVASGATTAGASTAATSAGGMWAAGTGASLQGIGWANAMVTAGAVDMTSNAAISTINNKGNLSLVLKDVTSKDALRGYAVSGITAGLTAGVFEGWTATKTDAVAAAGSTGALGNATTVLPPGGLSTLDGIGRFAGSQMLQNGTSAVLDRALGGNSSFSDALRNSLVNTFAAAGFKWVGDVSENHNLGLKDGGLPKIALHALMGGLAAEAAGSDFRTGALAAGVNEAVVGLLADQYTKMDYEDKKRLLVMNSQLIGVLTAAAAGGDAKDLQTGSWVAGSATSYNRLLHDAEKKAVTTEAAELQKRLGKPGTDLSWEDLLLLAANAEVDALENKRLQALVQMYDPNNPEGLSFVRDLQIAQQSISRLAAQNIVLFWKDGQPIMADGDEVKAFQATETQRQDHGLFNKASRAVSDSEWTQASGNNWGRKANTVPEAWKRQFGAENAALYVQEIAQVSSSPAEMQDLMDRVSVIVSGGLQVVTPDLDAAMLLMGAAAPLRMLLEKRIAVALAEARVKAAGKGALVDVVGSGGAKGAKGPATGSPSGETKVVGNGRPAANDASFTGAKGTGAGVDGTIKALPAPRQIDASWSASTYNSTGMKQ